MSLEDIFPETELSSVEQDHIQAIFSAPLVKKYLRILSLHDVKEFLALGAISTPEVQISQAFATVQGRLQIVSALLSITKSEPDTPLESQ